MSHLKRLRAPKSWPLLQWKGLKYIARPMPGTHKIENCITLNVILKDVLNYSNTTRESKKILNEGKVYVNNIVRKSHKFPVGILDTISLESLKEYYRVLYNEKGKICLEKISKEQTESKLVKIKNKKILKKKKTQLNFHDGTNLLVEKDSYKCGDSVMIKDKKIIKHLKFEKGAIAYLIGGKHKGVSGTLENVEESSAFTEGKITINLSKDKITTKKDFAFIIEKSFTK